VSVAPLRFGSSESTRKVELDATRNSAGAVTCSVSMMRAGDPIIPGAVTMMVSTYVPAARPAVSDCQRTVAGPVPLALTIRIRRGRAHAVQPAPASTLRLAESFTTTLVPPFTE
jgi:hypothetical protein